MHAEPQPSSIDVFHLRALEALSTELLATLETPVIASAIVDFCVTHVARAADLWLFDERGVCRSMASAGMTSTDAGDERVTQTNLTAHDTRVGFLRLYDAGFRGRCAPALVSRLCEIGARALFNARAYEHEQLVSLTFQKEAMGVDLPAIEGVRFDAVYKAGLAEALVGGDWYDAFALEDGRFVVSIGDVAGSGLNAAVTMVNVRQTLRGIAYVHADPILMVRGAEATLRSQYPGRYVTAFVAVIDPVTRSCSYVNCGHPAPMLRCADGSVRMLGGRTLPLGLHEFVTSLDASYTSLESGSLLVLYTDGLTEETRDPIRGEARASEVLANMNPAADDAARVLLNHTLREGAKDDVAILTMYFEAPLPLQRWRFDPRWSDVARRAKRELLQTLEHNGVPSRRRWAAELTFAELMANVIRYAEGLVEVILERRAGDFILHVLDKGPGFEFSPRLPSDLFSERGRGLFLISQFAREFTIGRRPGGGSHARIVLGNGALQ